jgi:murein DD-endopeptidase MepM/ murein hydrolase activator NlpD
MDSYAPQTDYVWGQPYHGGEEYTPTVKGESYIPFSVQLGTQLTNQGIDQWLLEKYPELNNFGGLGSGQNNPGQAGNPGTPKWSAVNQWNSQVNAAAQQVAQETGVYVPLNVIKAIMQIESQGVMPEGGNYAGAVGLMQVTASTMGQYDLQKAATDPAYSIYAGTKELALRYQDAQRQNPQYNWENAAVGFFSGHYEPTGAGDAYNTDFQYRDAFRTNMSELGMNTVPVGGDPTQGTGTQAPAGTKQFNAIWGGFDAPITQEIGDTPFSQNGMYDNYDYTLNIQGHPGLDVGVTSGTRLFSPVNGTVEIAGGTPYFMDDRFGQQPRTGELLLKLDNGDVLILGHMSQIIVNVGDRIVAGSPVGFSGTANGDHVHVEYRAHIPHPNGEYTAVDPRKALGGDFSGTLGAPPPGSTFAPANPNNWQSFLRAGAMGLPILQAPPENTFGAYLRQLMGVGPVVVGTNSQAPSGWSWDTFDPNPTGSSDPSRAGT